MMGIKSISLYACWLCIIVGWFIPSFSTEPFIAAAFVILALKN